MLFTTLVYLAFAANAPSLPPGKGKAIVQRDCVGCHALKVITSKRASREQWSTLVDQMVSRGADVPDEEIETVVDVSSQEFWHRQEATRSKNHPRHRPQNINRAKAISLRMPPVTFPHPCKFPKTKPSRLDLNYFTFLLDPA